MYLRLVDANGAGKTTTLTMVLGLVTPSTGSIRVLGHDLIRHRYEVLGRMNFSSPYVDLPQRLTVAENLTVYGRLDGAHSTRIRPIAYVGCSSTTNARPARPSSSPPIT